MAFSLSAKLNSVRTTFGNFGKFLYNSKKKTVLGRGGLSWLKIGSFYLVFYSCLAIFWSILLYGLLQYIDDKEPFITGSQSPLQNVPGLTRLPNGVRNFIEYNEEDYDNGDAKKLPYIVAINDFLIDTDKANHYHKDCQHLHEEKFGYNTGTPLIILKLNKVFFFKPSNKSRINCTMKSKFDTPPTFKFCPEPTDINQIANEVDFPSEYVYVGKDKGYKTQYTYLKIYLNGNYNKKIKFECDFTDGDRFTPRFGDNYAANSFNLQVNKKEKKVIDEST
ncbi:hypothetical protein A3Q56_07243 [Intoshia linei]|uniref:Sodium/potassium-transporting ATPase subunit beta n=1 Tax=Intoshia linei TaxID=1819745 RepID=A0A177ASQ3_9BILA|nr:hypothetical protein A3Q56_07243 [Intoshia linei]